MDNGKVVINAKRKVNGEWVDIDIDDIDWETINEIHVKGKHHFVRSRWIPVTERLPKEKQDVLLAFKHNMVVGFWEDILNDGGQAWYANSGNGWMTGTETVDDDGFPIAWMPLPEPWKGEQDE